MMKKSHLLLPVILAILALSLLSKLTGGMRASAGQLGEADASPHDETQASAGNVIRVDTAAEFQDAILGLLPGDTLIVEEGEYEMSYLDIRNISGTADEWITIQAEGPVVVHGTSYSANVVEIRNVHYLRFIGFEIWSETTPGSGVDGIKLQSSPSSYITFDRLYIHHVSGNGKGLLLP